MRHSCSISVIHQGARGSALESGALLLPDLPGGEQANVSLPLIVVIENSFRFRINEFTRLLKKVNDSYYKIKANFLTLCLNVRTSALGAGSFHGWVNRTVDNSPRPIYFQIQLLFLGRVL